METGYHTILVAVDGSKTADLAFEKAVQFAKQDKAKLVIAHVIDIQTFANVRANQKFIDKNVTEYAEELLQGYEQRARDAGVENIDLVIESGSPKTIIAKTIAPHVGAGLIVCGAVGMNAMERILIGSVSENIARYAKCDVYIVRPRTLN
ncbi:universal stress protein [Exiguobacterium flavidum]|uniref:universal stress protein n=1 Tax=Exiguobacterium flavidum TaxID=2184695 RepID=UPI000DF7AA5A|nr:universal stress protein [Exiguobacterium flavidum]